MRFYFIRTTWIVFILLGFYLIKDYRNDTFQKILYAVWIAVGIIYYFMSKDNQNHFRLAVIVALAITAIIIYFIKHSIL